METTYTIEFMRLAEPPSPQIKQPSGELSAEIDGKRSRMKTGDVAIVPPRV